MSDEGEKSCPLCAEEMDLTDQQLRPCKCGYEICVWCWHHIMDMAEKDGTEGRCPACRTPYNKEKIVGMTAKCGRLVPEMTAEKKLKSQKGKVKTLGVRKQLVSARVIQRNLVYVVGLPLNFADEDLLQRREYFGQYGKVLKVSISRTTAGSIQQFANSTCSVYITYSTEEEAVRCIQMVHGFTLDGRPLRACFGTTKYCHAWLRNVPCTNPDCLYLHEIGSQEDSFTKDEVISSYTRSRIQQVTSSSNSIQRRSGNVLPPPEDEKPIVKTAICANQNSATSGTTSPPNSSSERSAALPAGASWATRPCSSQPLPTSTPSSNGPLNQKTDTHNSPVAFSKAVPSQVYSFQNGTGEKNVPNEESTISLVKTKTEAFGPFKKESDADGNNVSDTSMISVHASVPLSSPLHSPHRTISLLNTSNTCDSRTTSSGLASKDYSDNVENICSDIVSLSIEKNQYLQNDDVEHIREPSICRTPKEIKNNTDVVHIASVHSDPILGRTDQLTDVDLPELDDMLSFHKQRIKDSEIACSRAPDFPDALNLEHSDFNSPVFGNADGIIGIGFNRQVVDRSINSIVSNSNLKNIYNNGAEESNLFLRKEKMYPVGRHNPEEGSGAIDIGESSIISSILPMDFDSWDVPVTSPQNLAKFLCESNRRQGPLGESGSWKTRNSGQSRFSFAREEEAMEHLHSEQSTTNHEHSFNQLLSGHNYSSGNRVHLEKFVSTNDLPVFSALEQDYLARNNSHIASNKLSVSRPQVSAPPGFSGPSRAAPPGFTSQGRTEQVFESHSGNYTVDTLSRNQYQRPSSGDAYTNGDIEFMDPAILAVGKGTFASSINNTGLDIRSNFPPQFNTFEETTLQSILQRSMPSHYNQRFSDLRNGLSTVGDAYGISSRIVEQTVSNNASPFSQFIPQSRNGINSNGQWDGWNEAQSANHLGIAELLRSERLGFSNKYFGGYEESKTRMPGSGNIYNETYGF